MWENCSLYWICSSFISSLSSLFFLVTHTLPHFFNLSLIQPSLGPCSHWQQQQGKWLPCHLNETTVLTQQRCHYKAVWQNSWIQLNFYCNVYSTFWSWTNQLNLVDTVTQMKQMPLRSLVCWQHMGLLSCQSLSKIINLKNDLIKMISLIISRFFQ